MAVPSDGEKKEYTSDELSLMRTRMSADRTLLSWVRTAMSFISFGFTMYKMFETLADAIPGAFPLLKGKPLGLLLMVMGTLPLAVGMLQHYKMSMDLGAGRRETLFGPTFALASVILLLGIVLFFNIVLKWNWL